MNMNTKHTEWTQIQGRVEVEDCDKGLPTDPDAIDRAIEQIRARTEQMEKDLEKCNGSQ